MIHYHGTPITPVGAAATILHGRHALVSFAHPEQMDLVAETCHSFVQDNGAFSFWKSKVVVDWEKYYRWVDDWRRHPGFDWALIPDVIDGAEAENDALLEAWPFGIVGVPVWHLHEPIDRLILLAAVWPRIAFGSSGQYAQVNSPGWWERMAEAMDAICDEQGRPVTKLHGLRMLDPRVFSKLPFASADSTNIGRNIGIDKHWAKGNYLPPSKTGRGVVMALRIEHQLSAPTWSTPSLQRRTV